MRIRAKDRGFGLFEMLMSLSILGMLLASIAAAIHTSLTSYHQNDNVAAVSQTVRSVLGRMGNDIRACGDVDLTSTTTKLTMMQPADGSGQDRRVQYEYLNGLLYYRLLVNGTITVNEVLLGGANDVAVTGFNAAVTQGKDWKGQTCAKTVTIRLDLKQDNQATSVTASASPRRNQVF